MFAANMGTGRIFCIEPMKITCISYEVLGTSYRVRAASYDVRGAVRLFGDLVGSQGFQSGLGLHQQSLSRVMHYRQLCFEGHRRLGLGSCTGEARLSL